MKKKKIETIKTTLRFMKFKKGCSDEIQIYIDEQIRELSKEPESGVLRKGDLKGVRAHTFTYKKQEYHIAYSFSGSILCLLQIGLLESYTRRLRQLLH